MRTTRLIHRSSAALAATGALLLVLAGCAGEGTGSATAVRTPDSATALQAAAPAQASEGTAPSEAWCAAYSDFEAAQDGAQLNTAIGEMEAALTDSSGEVAQALQTLQQGDLPASENAEAEAVLASYARGCTTQPTPPQPTG